MRRLLCSIAFSISFAWSAAWLHAQSSDVAVLKSGTSCYGRFESGVRCVPNGLAGWFGRDFAPILRLIDGKGPIDFGLKGWSGGFKDGFKVRLPAGKHTVTMAFHASAINMTSRSISTSGVTSKDISVFFTALGGHCYKLDVLTDNDPYWNLGSGGKWQPMIVDTTDKHKPVIVPVE